MFLMSYPVFVTPFKTQHAHPTESLLRLKFFGCLNWKITIEIFLCLRHGRYVTGNGDIHDTQQQQHPILKNL